MSYTIQSNKKKIQIKLKTVLCSIKLKNSSIFIYKSFNIAHNIFQYCAILIAIFEAKLYIIFLDIEYNIDCQISQYTSILFNIVNSIDHNIV